MTVVRPVTYWQCPACMKSGSIAHELGAKLSASTITRMVAFIHHAEMPDCTGVPTYSDKPPATPHASHSPNDEAIEKDIQKLEAEKIARPTSNVQPEGDRRVI